MLPTPTRLFDTSVFIDHLRGHSRAATLLITDAVKGVHPAAFSIITDAELWVGVKTAEDDRKHRILLRNMNRLLLSLEIARVAGRLRRTYNNMQLTDALIAATALHYSLPIYTRNPKHYITVDGLEVVPYKLTKDE